MPTREEDLVRLREPRNRTKLIALLHAYYAFVKIVETYRKDIFNPSNELNIIYRERLAPKIERLVNDLELQPDGNRPVSLPEDYIPFTNLYTAQQTYRDKGWSVDDLLMHVHSVYGILKDIAVEAGAVYQESEATTEAIVDEVRRLISQEWVRQNPVLATPAPLFIVTEWEGITIRFITDREVFVSTPNEQRQTDYEALGFLNKKTNRPNSAWTFLYGLALHNGETSDLSNPIPVNIKKQKQHLAERLKQIFGLNTDPFQSYRETSTYRIRIALEPPVEVEEVDR